MRVTLLGPQRETTTARAAVAELIPEGPIATVNAGWREREDDTAELDDVLGGRMRNLRLWARWRELIDDDPDFAAADRRLRDVLAEQQVVYQVRLEQALAAIDAVGRRGDIPSVRDAAVTDAMRTVQDLDHWHVQQVAEIRQRFYDRVRLGERPTVQRHRAELAELGADCQGWVIAGGHVGALLQAMHVFDVGRLINEPVIAWSAGAMALTEQIVLFNDFAAQGRTAPEVYAEGFPAAKGIVAFPHASRRLVLTEPARLARLAARFAPRTCLLLDPGSRADLADGDVRVGTARVVAADGTLRSPGA